MALPSLERGKLIPRRAESRPGVADRKRRGAKRGRTRQKLEDLMRCLSVSDFGIQEVYTSSVDLDQHVILPRRVPGKAVDRRGIPRERIDGVR